MLIVLKIIIAIYMWMVFPVILGSLWTENNKKLNIIFAYLTGFVSECAVFFVMAKWAIATELSLHELCRNWLIAVALLTLVCVVRGIKKKFLTGWKPAKYKKSELAAGALLLAVLIGTSIVCGGGNQNDFTVESALTMYATDTIYQYDATTGKNEDEMLSYQIENLENDAKSPIEAYYAANSFLCKLHPAKFVKVLLPIFLLPFYFGVYHVWAAELFADSQKKRIAFQVIVWLLYGTALISERALLFDVFSNCWNGETLFFAGLLPMAVWLLLRENNKVRWGAAYVVCALAGQLLYINGGFVITFIWAIALLAAGIKRWKNDSSI